MSKENELRIEELARQKMDGKSYSEIREELSLSGMTAREISVLIRQVDESVLRLTTEQAGPDRVQQVYRFGLILAVFGLILSIAYNAGVLLQHFPALLMYSPFLAGILIMLYGRFMQRKKQTGPEKSIGAIRKKRPYS